MANFNSTDEVKKQYGSPSHLNVRILLHQLYSTNKMGWSDWVFQQYHLRPHQTILELGCGSANIWRENREKIPHGVKLTLSDFSSGMLDVAKSNTDGCEFVEAYSIIDVQSIPFADGEFDMVIANHMLYHVPNVKMALGEIARVLKSDGVFYATTIGNNNFIELIHLLHDFDEEMDYAHDSITKAFGLESGKDLLEQYFHSVESKRHEDSLHITKTKPLVDYVLSLQGVGNVKDIIIGEKVDQFTRYIKQIIEGKGFIDITKDAGILISRAPRVLQAERGV